MNPRNVYIDHFPKSVHQLLKDYKSGDAKSALDHIDALNEIMRRRNK